MSTKHNYTNPAFCQNSEFYPVPSAAAATANKENVESIYNRSLQINFNANATRYDARDSAGPLRIQRSMSTRSVAVKKTKTDPTTTPTIHQQLHRQQQQHYERQQHHHQHQQQPPPPPPQQQQKTLRPANLNRTAEPFEMRSGSGRYALVPVEELSTDMNNRYAIVPGPAALQSINNLTNTSNNNVNGGHQASPLVATRRYAKSQDDLDRYSSQLQLEQDEPHSFHEDPTGGGAGPYASLPPVLESGQLHPKRRISLQNRQSSQQNLQAPKIKHAFSSDFGSKTFLIVDKNSNQRYQMVPTAEDEELVDDNQEIIQMHNGKAHRYAVIPAEDDDDDYENNNEEETCLSNPDLNQSQNFLPIGYETTRTPMRTSTPQKGMSMGNLASYPSTPLKNPQATKMLHELLSTPRKTPSQNSRSTTPRNMYTSQRELRIQYAQQGQQVNFSSGGGQTQVAPPLLPRKNSHLSPQRLHYETVKPVVTPPHQNDRTMAVIQPRVAGTTYPQIEEEDCSSIQGKAANNQSYPQKIVSATITLAIVSLMLVLGSSMNSALIVYMIAHLGRSFYLQFSLVAAISGVGLGFLGFRSRHCEWLPNRSYTSGYILVTVFCLLKCCCLLVILVLDPFPGLPLHDVTTGIILGLSTFTMFFIGLGVIGTLWCYRPPPDNRVNVV
ncbi:sanpodo [Musca autumnalis]|uniref:sanpodo n=1 Tax=Musca autumnalis TaxID=221902 RepID=UPI003CEF9608